MGSAHLNFQLINTNKIQKITGRMGSAHLNFQLINTNKIQKITFVLLYYLLIQDRELMGRASSY